MSKMLSRYRIWATAAATTLILVATITYSRDAAAHKHRQEIKDLPGTINGAVTPELIPDVTAYLLFFRTASTMVATPGKERVLRSYLAMAGMNASDPDGAEGPLVSEQAELIKLVHSFAANVRPLDEEVKGIKFAVLKTGRAVADPLAELRCRELELRKREMVNWLIAEAPTSLGAETAAKLRTFVTRQVKGRSKIYNGNRPIG